MTRIWKCSRGTQENSCKRIFTDKLSGAQAERPGLKEALSHLREADTLVIWKLDRLGRSMKGLADLVNELETQKVHFQRSPTALTRRRPQDASFPRDGELPKWSEN
jgi:DNA invertase Pin-like site-specific DNA recombinase